MWQVVTGDETIKRNGDHNDMSEMIVVILLFAWLYFVIRSHR
jgi:hypothetical protein